MENESGKTPAKPTGVDFLDNPQLYELFISVVDKRVNVEFRSRNKNIRSWIIGACLVLAGFAGLGAFAVNQFVSVAVNEKVNSVFEESVPRAVEKTVGLAVDEALDGVELNLDAIKFDAGVVDLNFHLLRLDFSDTFAEQEAEAIIEKLGSVMQSVVLGDLSAQELSTLAFVVDTAVKNFASAERMDLVKRVLNVVTQIDDYKNSTSRLLDSDIVVQTMVLVNGMSLLGDAGAPSSWTEPTGLQKQAYLDYKEYAARAQRTGYPELYLLFEILLGYIQQKDEEAIMNFIADTKDLNPSDADNFISLMFRLATNQTKKEPDVASTRTAKRVVRFLCEYGDRNRLLKRVVAQVFPEGVERRC